MLSQQQGHYATKACSNCQQRHVKCSGKVTCNYCKLRDLERVFIKDHKKCEPKLKQNYQSENNYKKLNPFNTGFTAYQNESIIGIKFYQLVWKDLKDEFKTSNIKEFDYSLFNDQKQKSYVPVLEKLTPKSASQINSFQPVLKSRVTIKNKVRRSTRPPNAFFLYRREKIKEFEAKGERISIVEVSKIIAGMWKKESPIVKIEFDRMAVLECEKFFNQELGFMRLSCRRKTKFKIYKPYNVENSKKSAELQNLNGLNLQC
ncbi:41284_t:CDS:2 [Gigaspora margarita]|uniref:41284_t:CDS:1 n=1 Tax=Gigaspora margarita TaxID=4874 RepID=A0ABM8VYV9_GIGMA|nr:41284_t:CDS:2 [Gigaspora margarita]